MMNVDRGFILYVHVHYIVVCVYSRICLTWITFCPIKCFG